MRAIDVNADAGEGADDAALMPMLTSVSIACGGHAGDASTMARCLALARRFGLRAGAHPSYPDRPGFGRRPYVIAPEALRAAVESQVVALSSAAAGAGVALSHVKAHGALYNRAWEDEATAAAIADAVFAVDSTLALFCPAGSAQARAAEGRGLRVFREVFLDRAYDGGRLRPRGQPGAMVAPGEQLRLQVDWLSSIEFDTMCVHGDNPLAATLLAAAIPMLAGRGLRPQ